MHTSVGKLAAALAERGKGKQAREVLEQHGFDPDTTNLELGPKGVRGVAGSAERLTKDRRFLVKTLHSFRLEYLRSERAQAKLLLQPSGYKELHVSAGERKNLPKACGAEFWVG